MLIDLVYYNPPFTSYLIGRTCLSKITFTLFLLDENSSLCLFLVPMNYIKWGPLYFMSSNCLQICKKAVNTEYTIHKIKVKVITEVANACIAKQGRNAFLKTIHLNLHGRSSLNGLIGRGDNTG